jgi:hypothetical protein
MGSLAPFGGMLRRAGSVLRSGEAAGYLKGIFVRKSVICRELVANVVLCMSR